MKMSFRNALTIEILFSIMVNASEDRHVKEAIIWKI